jgi:hypothetical protein
MKKGRAEHKIERAIRLYTECDGICYLCEKPLGKEYSDLLKFYGEILRKGKVPKPNIKRAKININEDHVVPRAVGVVNSPENIRLTHMTCNGKKGSMLYEEYISQKQKVQSV